MNLENLNKCGKRIDEYVEMLQKTPYGVDMPKLLAMSREDAESITTQLHRSADALSVILKLLWGQTDLQESDCPQYVKKCFRYSCFISFL